MLWHIVPFVVAVRSVAVHNFLGSSGNITAVNQAWASGEPAALTVKLVAPDTTVLETQTVNVELERLQGQAVELDFMAALRNSQAQPGLTDQQAESLQIVQASVTAGSPFGIIDVASGLVGELLTANSFELGQLTDPPEDLTGDGVLDLDVLFSFVWGVYFTADIPVGFGKLHGQTVEYKQRLVQFRTVHIVDGVELVTEVLDANYHGYLWRIAQPNWERVEYSVTPGVVIHAQWWIWP